MSEEDNNIEDEYIDRYYRHVVDIKDGQPPRTSVIYFLHVAEPLNHRNFSCNADYEEHEHIS